MDTYLEATNMENPGANETSEQSKDSGLKRKLSSSSKNSENNSTDEATASKRRKSSRNSTSGTVSLLLVACFFDYFCVIPDEKSESKALEAKKMIIFRYFSRNFEIIRKHI